MMKLEIFRKRHYPGGYVVDDEPETVFEKISQLEIRGKYIFGNIEGEELTVLMDKENYKYIVV